MERYELVRGSYRRLTLRVRGDGSLRVTAPWFVRTGAIDQFVDERRDWIQEHRRLLAAQPAVRGPLETVSVWGQVCQVRILSPGRLPRVIHEPSERVVLLRVPSTWDDAKHRSTLAAWQKQRVTAALEEAVPRWANRMGLSVAHWTVKNLRSRWGSCQPATRRLVFNAALGAFPPECLEHVVVHELVHLLEPSHNARFHALVESWLPGSARVRKILKSGIDSGAPAAGPGPHATEPGETEP